METLIEKENYLSMLSVKKNIFKLKTMLWIIVSVTAPCKPKK